MKLFLEIRIQCCSIHNNSKNKSIFCEGIMKYKRIIIIGSSGSGKSYLAKRVAEVTEYPLIHLDNEFWKPGWTKTPRDEWIEKQRKIIAAEKWILDGNYDSTLYNLE